MYLDLEHLSLELTAGRADQFPRAGTPAGRLPQVAFSGRSNVGKSSLINALSGKKGPARVSSMPGKTVTVNFYNAGNKAYLVDLPGYGYAKRNDADRRRWSELTDAYLTQSQGDRLRLIVQLIDMTAGPSEDDLLMIDWMTRLKVPYIIAVSKSDKPTATDRAAMLETVKSLGGARAAIPVSAKNGEGIKALTGEIVRALS